MRKKIVAVGKTIDDAIKNGLTQLGAAREEVEVRILEQPSKGLFGLIGNKDAKVELELLEKSLPDVKDEEKSREPKAEVSAEPVRNDASPMDGGEGDPIEETIRFLEDVFDAMNVEVQLTTKRTDKDSVTIIMKGEEIGMLIGRRGQTLDALQYLSNIVMNRMGKTHTKIVLDAENFRDRRRQTLEELAERLARKVVKTRKEVVLEPMSPQDRKIIHSTLQDHPNVKTFSKGEEPNRRVVITLK
jgi:spoIIIJ-associated protein